MRRSTWSIRPDANSFGRNWLSSTLCRREKMQSESRSSSASSRQGTPSASWNPSAPCTTTSVLVATPYSRRLATDPHRALPAVAGGRAAPRPCLSLVAFTRHRTSKRLRRLANLLMSISDPLDVERVLERRARLTRSRFRHVYSVPSLLAFARDAGRVPSVGGRSGQGKSGSGLAARSAPSLGTRELGYCSSGKSRD